MKGILILELFGEDTRQTFKLYRMIFEACCGDWGRAYFDKCIGMPPRSSWVAEITGPDKKYGLARSFLRGKIDYSKANSKGSRGIFCEYILEQEKIYEVKSQISWKNAERYFCAVSEDGDIIKIDEGAVCHSFGALTKEERIERSRWSIAEITGPDEKYGLARSFLQCNYRCSEDDEKHLYPGFNLQEQKVYEIWYQGKQRKERTYCKVASNGEITKISEEEACRSVGALTREERREKRIAERISGNQCT